MDGFATEETDGDKGDVDGGGDADTGTDLDFSLDTGLLMLVLGT